MAFDSIRIAAIIAIFVVAYSLLGFILSVVPPKFRSSTTPEELGLPYEEVRFKTEDGVELSGWLVKSNVTRPTIIVGHGYPFDKGNVLPAMSFLHPQYNLLFFDFRSFGQSNGIVTTAGWRETKDVDAAVKYLKSRKDIRHKFGAIGFSMSAASFIMAKNEDIEAIVADSSYANMDLMIERTYLFFGPLKFPFVWMTKLYALAFFGINSAEVAPEQSIKDRGIPVLLIHGGRDSQISVDNSRRIYENSDKALTELWIVADADHGQAYALKTSEYKKRVLGFFDENLG